MIPHRPHRLVALALPVVLLLAPAGAQEAEGAPPTHVLIVTLEAARADRLGCYGFEEAHTPRFDALAERGVRFERAYTHCPLTLPAHASLMSGRTPLEHGVHDDGTQALPPSVPVLAEAFHARGYRTGAFVSSLELDDLFGLSRGFELYDDDLGPADDLKALKRTRPAHETARAAAKWIAAKDERPFFCWVQLSDPSAPYEPPYDVRQRVEDPYQGELSHADASFANLVEALGSKGLEERTLVVLVGSMGESLGEHGEEGHGALITEANVRVPLVVSLPGRIPAGRVSDALVGHADLAPTIAELLGWPTLEGATGRGYASLLADPGAAGEGQPRSVYLESELCARRFGWSTLRGLVRGPWKLVRSSASALYDLAADPTESKNLVEERPEVAAELAAALDALVAAGRARGIQGVPVSGRTVQDLAAIDSEPLRGAPGGRLPEASGPDPAQRIESVPHYREALELAYVGRPSELVAPLELAVAASPDTATLHLALAIAFERAREFERSRAALEVALELDPQSSAAHYYMGRMLIQTGQPESAESFFALAAELAPDSYRAQHMMVARLLQDGREAEALPYMRRVVELAPTENLNWQRYIAMLRTRSEWAEVVGACGEAAKHFPDDLWYPNFEAWVLATSADESVRDPERAVAIARELAERTEMKDPGILDTLAAALASKGEFEEAQSTVSKGILIAHEMKIESLVADMRERLARYREQKPYVETP